jgi:hypothetical protein
MQCPIDCNVEFHIGTRDIRRRNRGESSDRAVETSHFGFAESWKTAVISNTRHAVREVYDRI